MAEIGDDEGMLGNDFAMAHKLTVRPPRVCRVSPKPLQSERGAHGTAPAMHHLFGHSSKGNNGRNPCSPGCGTGDACTAYHHLSPSGRSYPQIRRNGDDRVGTRTVGAVPGPRSGRSRTGQQDLDDILVFGPDFETTLARLESVLDRLGKAGLKLKAKKCQLFQEEIPFLGHIVLAAGIGADSAKCQQLRDWPVPRDLHEVGSFVGLCSYYRGHIQGRGGTGGEETREARCRAGGGAKVLKKKGTFRLG